MNERTPFDPGPADAEVRKEGARWTIVLVRDLRHPPQKVWNALTRSAELRAWSPFDSDADLDRLGKTVNLTTVGAPSSHVTPSTIRRFEEAKLLEFNWGDSDVRWELEPIPEGTRLTLWASIDRNFVSMGAAGWHVCIAVMDGSLAGKPYGRIVGLDALEFAGWQRLNAEYAELFGVEAPKW